MQNCETNDTWTERELRLIAEESSMAGDEDWAKQLAQVLPDDATDSLHLTCLCPEESESDKVLCELIMAHKKLISQKWSQENLRKICVDAARLANEPNWTEEFAKTLPADVFAELDEENIDPNMFAGDVNLLELLHAHRRVIAENCRPESA